MDLSKEIVVNVTFTHEIRRFSTLGQSKWRKSLWALGAFHAAHVLASVSITKSNLIRMQGVFKSG